ncbi:uncharacterized protein LOC142179936 [Nicotiana tabacum]|uniref:Uncharacterized protein LOC142179936 n=1 Tax=Nicotiana tabacum TaxID=4097 RepID=A0AC58UBR5_TOBAC
MVDGTYKKENFSDTMRNHWERVNAIVLSWIMNSVVKGLLGGIMYASSAQAVCEDLSERFNKVDGPRTFNLHTEIATLTQGTASVSVYYSRLKDLWEEFEALVPAPGCDCEKSRDFVIYLQKLKLYQFLMGLNDSYSQARSQILMRSSLPTINQAYAMIVSDESQKFMPAASGLLGTNPTTVTGNYDLAMYSKNYNNQPRRFNKNYNIQCEFYSLKGHIKENCYKIVEYPAYFKFKKKGTGGHHPNYRANVVNILTETTSGSQNFQNESVTNQLGNYTFTKDQYDQIVQMLNKVSIPASANSAANIAVETEKPKKVFLPNGDITQVTHIDLFTGKVREIGKEEDGIYILLSQIIEKNKRIDLAASEAGSNLDKQLDVDLWHKRLVHMSIIVLQKKMVRSRGHGDTSKGRGQPSRGQGRGTLPLSMQRMLSKKATAGLGRAAEPSKSSLYVPSREASKGDSVQR